VPELRFQNLRKEAAMLLKTQDRAQEVETARRAVSGRDAPPERLYLAFAFRLRNPDITG